jgi:hypothetical protein
MLSDKVEKPKQIQIFTFKAFLGESIEAKVL